MAGSLHNNDSPSAPTLRVGLGDDRHRLAAVAPAGEGRPLVVGGVALESPVGPVSRSDGDALLHAVTDALLGAAGLADIGQLFPDSDDANEGRDSCEFLREARRLLDAAGWRIVNIDAVVRLETPRIAPVKDVIRQIIATCVEVDLACVNVKGKTGEKVGPVGEGQAIEAQAVALLMKQRS